MKGPLKLSPEMRILLTVLILVALVGGWYTFNTSREAASGAVADEAVSIPASPVTAAPVPSTPVAKPAASAAKGAAQQTPTQSGAASNVAAQPKTSAAQSTSGTGVNAGVVTPARPTSSITIPPLSAAAPSSASDNANAQQTPGTPSSAPVTGSADSVTRAPAGINPAATLADVPPVNPFTPLRVIPDQNSGGQTLGTPTAALPASSSQPPLAQTAPTPARSVTPIRQSGVLPATNVPLSSPELAGPVRTTGVLPAPTIQLGDAASAAAQRQAAQQAAEQAKQAAQQAAQQAQQQAQAAAQAKAQAAQAARQAAQAAARQAAISAAQQRARTQARVSEPALGMLDTPGAPPTASAAPTSAGSVSAAVPTLPVGVITQLGGAGGAATSTSLERYLQEQGVSFNAVVLGPINTAIFKTSRGFVVVPVGQTLPDTNITVREVSAQSATLSLDNNTKTLELDKR